MGNVARDFEADLGVSEMWYISEHVVHGRVVVPGACFVECVSGGGGLGAVGAPCSGGVASREPLVLVGTAVVSPLAMGRSGSRTRGESVLRLRTWATGAEGYGFEVGSRCLGVDAVHATGHARNGAQKASMVSRLACAVRAGCSGVPVGMRRTYAGLAGAGIVYGCAFRAVASLWDAGSVRWAASSLRMEGGVADVEGYAVHPVLIDGCLQSLGFSVSGARDWRPARGPVLQVVVPTVVEEYGATSSSWLGGATGMMCRAWVGGGGGHDSGGLGRVTGSVEAAGRRGMHVHSTSLHGVHMRGIGREALEKETEPEGGQHGKLHGVPY